MSAERRISLHALYERLQASMRAAHDDDECWVAHAEILDRLESNRQAAEQAGWSSLAVERDGVGVFRLFGVAPGRRLRAEVPDSTHDAGA